MIQYLYDNNIIIYTFAALCGLGLLLRLIVNMVYKHLVKETDSPDEMKNKMLKKMKLKFETLFKLKIGVNNVDTFVDKSVLKYRFCGALLSTWENISGQVLFLNLLLVPICAVFGVTFDCGQDQIMLAGAVGISTSALLILVDKGINLLAKKRLLRLNLLDYLENFCKVRLEKEVFHPELLEQYRREYFQVEDGNQQVSAIEEITVKQEIKEEPKDEPKDELNRRREARRKKEEERKLQAAKREEEQRKLEEVRKEEEKRRLEERRQMAAKRREEERLKLEEEREALEARRAELKRRASEKQLANERKLEKKEEKAPESEEINKEGLSVEEEKPQEVLNSLNELNKGLEEVAAESEQAILERTNQEQPNLHKVIVINHIEKKTPEQERGADVIKDTKNQRLSEKAASTEQVQDLQEKEKQLEEKSENEKLNVEKTDAIKSEKEIADKVKVDKVKTDKEKVEKEKQQKASSIRVKIPGISPQEEKIIEDVLRDFFA